MKEIKAPKSFVGAEEPTLFLAGTIDNGASEDWQALVVRHLTGIPGTILNPRRDDWDDTWVQRATFTPFREQVEWEQNAMERATWIGMNFLPDSKSPITLFELGLHIRHPGLIVCCPKTFYRFGNVEIVAARWGVRLYCDIQPWLSAVERAVLHSGRFYEKGSGGA